MSQPQPKRNKLVYLWFLVPVLLLVGLLVTFYLGATALSSVFGSKYAYRPRPDAEGNVELTLLYAREPGDANPAKWTLKIPHQYINSIVGDQRAVGPENTVTVYLFGEYKNLNSEKSTLSSTEYLGEFINISIHVFNRHSSKYIFKNRGCISSNSELSFLNESNIRKCETPGCSIYDSLDGWLVEYSVFAEAAKSPQPICKLMRKFLNEHTVQRDKILNQGD